MSEPTRLPCPRCQTTLVSGTRAGVLVDICPACGGVWLDHGELEAAAAEPGESGAPVRDVAYLKCPQCRTIMTRKNYERFSGVMVDTCPRHGTWTDRGELDRIRSFREAGGLARREAKEAEERRLAASVERFGTARSARSVVTPLTSLDAVLVDIWLTSS